MILAVTPFVIFARFPPSRGTGITIPLGTPARTVSAKRQADPAFFIDDIDRGFASLRDEITA